MKTKTYNVTNRVSQHAQQQMVRILQTHDNHSNAFNWKPDFSAGGRRANERRFERNNPPVTFINGDTTINVSMDYSESCNNVYYKLRVEVTKDGNTTKGTIANIKKLLYKK